MGMENIEHVVYLMLENRSLDNVLGWLYENDKPLQVLGQTPSGYQDGVFEGLQTGPYKNPVSPRSHDTVPVSKIKTSMHNFQTIPSVDPNEEFGYVQKQIATVQGIKMGGFLSDFTSVSGSTPDQIMQCYTPESLPIINWLAKNFAVSDAYFSSIPSQTNANRAFSLTGNSIGWWSHFNSEKGARVNNEWQTDLSGNDGLDPFQFTQKTLFNVLADQPHPVDWKLYYSQLWADVTVGGTHYPGTYPFTYDLLETQMESMKGNLCEIEEFFSHASAGTLPKFSYLEPKWLTNGVKDGVTIHGHNGNSYHPPADVAPGEVFLHQVYTALLNSPNWDNTLLIINFDEHGGTYDHIVPPNQVLTPWQVTTDGTPNPTNKEASFQFDRLGVRVPLILVSPWIAEKTVIRSNNSNYPFDHTSVIATILDWLQIPRNTWLLGSRTKHATTFNDVFNSPSPRTVIPTIPAPLADEQSGIEHAPNDLQMMISRRMLIRAARHCNYPLEKLKTLLDNYFKGFDSVPEMNRMTRVILDMLDVHASGGNSNENGDFSEDNLALLKTELQKLGLNYNAELFNAIVNYLGDSLNDRDESLVACSDPEELKVVKNEFLIQKLNLEDAPNLDTTIEEVCQIMGKSNRHKHRASFYYLLVAILKKESVFI
jgi:phospholipase C